MNNFSATGGIPILVLFLIGCDTPTLGARYGNYYLSDNDLDHVSIVHSNYEGTKEVVPEFVSAYRVDKGIIYAKQMLMSSYECVNSDGNRYIKTVRSDQAKFWIIDTKNETVLGPLDLDAYVLRAAKQGINEPSKYTQTYNYRVTGPNGQLPPNDKCEKIT